MKQANFFNGLIPEKPNDFDPASDGVVQCIDAIDDKIGEIDILIASIDESLEISEADMTVINSDILDIEDNLIYENESVSTINDNIEIIDSSMETLTPIVEDLKTKVDDFINLEDISDLSKVRLTGFVADNQNGGDVYGVIYDSGFKIIYNISIETTGDSTWHLVITTIRASDKVIINTIFLEQINFDSYIFDYYYYRLYLCCKNGNIYIIRNGVIEKTLSGFMSNIHRMAFDSINNHIWVYSDVNNSISIIDGFNMEVEETILNVYGTILQIVYNRATHRVYFFNSNDECLNYFNCWDNSLHLVGELYYGGELEHMIIYNFISDIGYDYLYMVSINPTKQRMLKFNCTANIIEKVSDDMFGIMYFSILKLDNIKKIIYYIDIFQTDECNIFYVNLSDMSMGVAQSTKLKYTYVYFDFVQDLNMIYLSFYKYNKSSKYMLEILL